MKNKIVGLVGVVWGGAIAWSSFKGGLSTETSYASGTTFAFGIGVLMFLAGVSVLWNELNGRESSFQLGSALVMVAIAAAVTFAALKWSRSEHPSTSECEEALDHVRGLVYERDPHGRHLDKFDRKREGLLNSCTRGTHAERKCALEAETLEAVEACEQ